MGAQAAAKELGIVVDDLVIEAATDSSAAKSHASQRGTGRVRHMEVRHLWLQQAVAEGKFKLVKVLGTANPADVLTKYKGLNEFTELLGKVNVAVVVAGHGRGGGERGGLWDRLGDGVLWADADE